MKKGIILAAALVICFAAVAQAADVVKIAVPSPYTGDAAAYGENVKAGVEIFVDEINAAGGIDGVMIEPVFLDEQCVAKEAATVSQKIVSDDDIVAIVGHLCSSAHLAALPNYVDGGIAAVSPTATNPSISDNNKDRDGKAWSFRVVYRDDFQGAFLAEYAKNVLGLERVAVFYQNDDYGIGLKDAFVEKAKEIGLELVGEEAYVRGTTTDFNPQLTALKEANPQALFISGYYNEGALIASQAAQLGMDVVKLGGEGLDNPDYITLGGEAAENTYITAPFLEESASPAAKEFLEKFKARYERASDYMSVNSYDAIAIIAQAIKEAGADRAAIRDYLASLNSPENGFDGISGLTFFDENGDCQKPAFVKVVKDGAMVAAEQM